MRYMRKIFHRDKSQKKQVKVSARKKEISLHKKLGRLSKRGIASVSPLLKVDQQ